MQKPVIKKVRAEDLTMDLRVQRELDYRRVRQIAANLKLEAIGTLCVSKRDDGMMIVIDGGHRRAALIEAELGEVAVNAEVYSGLTLADEAALFRYRNTTQKVGYLDRFRVRLIEGEEDAVAVQSLAKRHGWAVVSNDESGMPLLNSVKKLEELYLRNSEVADAVLKVSTNAFGYNPSAVDYRILDGLGKFLNRYWLEVDVSDLENKLTTVNGAPDSLVHKAQGLREMLGCSTGSAMAEIITEVYNKGKKHNGSRLPSWRS